MWCLGRLLTIFGCVVLLAAPALAEEDVELLTEVPTDAVWPPTELADGTQLGLETPLVDPTGQALKQFYESLQRVGKGEGKARVVVYGASHMAADSFTQHIRHRLQERFGNGGPGFVVGAKPWRSYNNRDVRIRYDGRWKTSFVSQVFGREDGLYGFAGVSWASNRKHDFSRFETNTSGDWGRRFSDVEVYYWAQPRGGDFYVIIDGKKKKVRTKSRKAKPGYARFELADGPHQVELRPRGNGEVRFFGVSLERRGPGVVMDTAGINGARAQSHLEWRNDLYKEHLAKRRPDLLILAYGTNATGDADDPIEEYERRFDRVLTKARAATAGASCIYIGPSDRPIKVGPYDLEPSLAKRLLKEQGRHADLRKIFPKKAKKKRRRASRKRKKKIRTAPLFFRPRPRQAQVIDVQRKVSLKHGCAYWDWNAMMGGELSMIKWVHAKPRLGSKDYVHHNRGGYKRASDLFWDALMAGYPALPAHSKDGDKR
jgi:lysophospholipase L1-like esterase